MKRLFLAFLMIVLAVGVAGAKKKDKAGSIKDGVYTDKKYGFSLNTPDSWNTTIKKNKKSVRIILTKKEYDVPMQFQHAPNYTKVPKVIVYADTTSLLVGQFIDSLLSDKFKSKQKKSVLSEFELLFGDYKQKKRSKLVVGDLTAMRIAGQQRYTIQVQRQGSNSDKGDIVTDFYSGSVFFAKEGNIIVMAHFICEGRYFSSLEKEFVNLVNGFKFIK